MILKLFSVTCLAAACDYPVCINNAHTTSYKNYAWYVLFMFIIAFHH